jgi:hypothetical protein
MLRWNEVTWYSKLGAAIVIFVALPTLSFYIGVQYNQVMTFNLTPPVVINFLAPNLAIAVPTNGTSTKLDAGAAYIPQQSQASSTTPTNKQVYQFQGIVLSATTTTVGGVQMAQYQINVIGQNAGNAPNNIIVDNPILKFGTQLLPTGKLYKFDTMYDAESESYVASWEAAADFQGIEK